MMEQARPQAQQGGAGPVPATVRHPVSFTGTAGEYFGIWIVNVVLSVLTLGIYSAWAKVRTQRYFYGNTHLAGSTFDYSADPIRILKGRLIAYAVVIVLLLSSQFLPVLYFVLVFAVWAVVPLLIVWSMRFRARYSAWRGLTFRFVHRPGQAYGPYLLWPLIAMLTGTLLYPLAVRRQHEFVAGGHRFGTAAFDYRGDSGAYYVPYLITLAGVMGVGILMAIGMVALTFGFAALGQGEEAADPMGFVGLAILALMLVFYALLFLAMGFLRVRYANLFWNSTALGPHRFESTLRAREVLWLYFGNLVVILLTLGLAIPWAKIRLARYRAEHFAVLAAGSLDGFVAGLEAERHAAGAELVDAIDVDVDIGI